MGHDPTGQGRGGGHDPEGAGRCIKKRKIEETQQSIVMDCEGSNLLLLSLGWGRCVATIDGGMFLCSLFVFSSTADNSACARSTPKCCTCAASAAASSGNLSVRVAQFLFFPVASTANCFSPKKKNPSFVERGITQVILFFCWNATGHPCIGDEEASPAGDSDAESLHVPVPPQAFLKFFSL